MARAGARRTFTAAAICSGVTTTPTPAAFCTSPRRQGVDTQRAWIVRFRLALPLPACPQGTRKAREPPWMHHSRHERGKRHTPSPRAQPQSWARHRGWRGTLCRRRTAGQSARETPTGFTRSACARVVLPEETGRRCGAACLDLTLGNVADKKLPVHQGVRRELHGSNASCESE